MKELIARLKRLADSSFDSLPWIMLSTDALPGQPSSANRIDNIGSRSGCRSVVTDDRGVLFKCGSIADAQVAKEAILTEYPSVRVRIMISELDRNGPWYEAVLDDEGF